MTYQEYKERANNVKSYAEADAIINTAAEDETITYQQYAWIRHLAYKAAYKA